jgi:hypothetical protein
MIVVVTGGRDYNNLVTVFKAIMALQKRGEITLLVNGGAKGADTVCRIVAEELRIPVWTEHADWTKHGKRAGPIRNQKMIDDFKPDILLYFPGGSGTADMKSCCEKTGIKMVDGEKLAQEFVEE